MALGPGERKILECLRTADLSPPLEVGKLTRPSKIEGLSLPCHGDEARSLLIQQRINQPGYKAPERQLLNKLSHRRLRRLSDQSNWTFTKHEVAAVFDTLISNAPLAAPGIAQAVLQYASEASLDELWCHLLDPKFEKRTKSWYRRSKTSVQPEATWLKKAVQAQDVDYLGLMCQSRVSQSSLNEAFGIALFKGSMDAMEALLRYGANASGCKQVIREHIRQDNIVLARLLLSSPHSMSVEAWRYCLEPHLKISPEVFLLCLAHRPDAIDGHLLRKAMELRHFSATATILAYAGPEQIPSNDRDLACRLVCGMEDHNSRHGFFKLLGASGFMQDSEFVQRATMKALRRRQLPLVRTLVNAGVSLDVEPNNALAWAVSHVDLEALQVLKSGRLLSPVSPLLRLIPDCTSEQDMLRLLALLGSYDLEGEPLDLHLVRAVRKQHRFLVVKLLRLHASVEYEQAAAIRLAVAKADFGILGTLLKSSCSPLILSAAVPTAMDLQPKGDRLKAFQCLLAKGLPSQELAIPLERVVAEDGEVDLSLIRLFLQYGASPDTSDNDTTNSVLVATSKGKVAVLKLLCNAGPRKDTLSKAVRVAFRVLANDDYDVALWTIKLLLTHGASGYLIHETLLAAVVSDSRLDIVRVLVKHGADANYRDGKPFVAALEARNLELLKILCSGCPPTEKSSRCALPTLVDARHYSAAALEMLLGCTPNCAAILNATWASGKLEKNPNLAAIILCFLRYGLDVNVQNGELLCLAIKEANPILLRKILAANPNMDSLKTAFLAGTSVRNRVMGILFMTLLLEQAKSAEIGQSAHLLQETRLALAGDSAGLQLMLRYRVTTDSHEGEEAIQAAATSGSLPVLHLLCTSLPSTSLMAKACLAAAAASELTDQRKDSVCEYLFTANGGILRTKFSALLTESVRTLPNSKQLPTLLLARGAKVTVSTLKLAMLHSSSDVFVLLLDKTKDADVPPKLFRHAQKLTMPSDRRLWVYQRLLNKGIPAEDATEGLLDSLRSHEAIDLAVLNLLLQHGADIDYQNGRAFELALEANASDALLLLSRYICSDDMANIAFSHARKARLDDALTRLRVYCCLLQHNVSENAIQGALLECFYKYPSDTDVLRLLLRKGANPNKGNAACFVLAAKWDRLRQFQALSDYADLDVVLGVLIKVFTKETEVARWFEECLRCKKQSARIEKVDLVFECLRKFPKGFALLRLVFDNSSFASTMVPHIICPGWNSEPCTALLWALLRKPKLENSAILALLACGKAEVRPEYLTPTSQTSATLACLLDPTRTPILKSLLAMSRNLILSQEIPLSTLEYLATYPNVPEQDPNDKSTVPILTAALNLGNFEAFQLLTNGRPPNERGLLHLATLFALPKFVKYLLQTHDPNLKLEEYDHRIPLALAIETNWSSPICKIANAEGDFNTRRMETIKLLAPKTNLKWRFRGKTVLHFALEAGVETTMVLITALDIENDSDRYEKYKYTDRAGKVYSPFEYVVKFMDVDEREKKRLRKCIAKAGLLPRGGYDSGYSSMS